MGFHGTDFFPGDRFFYGAVDAAFAVSKQVADLAEAHVGKRPELIPNPVDIDFFAPQEERKKNEEWHLVSSGRLVGWKGFSNLIEAAARLRDEHQIDAKLTVAGEGPEREALATRISALGLGPQVTFCGLLDAPALRDLLRSGDLYVLPSIGMEAFSISALEGACTGLPLLLSDQVGLAGFLTEADVVTYPARDMNALVAALKKLYEHHRDPAWTDRRARHARLHGQFSAERVARQIIDLIS
ncbi:MAG TPA: glycosyltransferase family 4 protein, partial [Candidatus Methylacidiphilales bacterium]